MTKGCVYIFANLCMPGLVKVDWTGGDPEVRARKLSANTNMSTAFVVPGCARWRIRSSSAWRVPRWQTIAKARNVISSTAM
jgi:hypothetical protein